MDYYQGVVIEYLRANRSTFVNTECCIQLKDAPNPDGSGPHWYCDAVAVDFEERAVYLCEVSFSKSLQALLDRLTSWSEHWPALKASLVRDCRVPAEWTVRPWMFVPAAALENAIPKIQAACTGSQDGSRMPFPRVTTLEAVVPWAYCSWNRKNEAEKSPLIPKAMQI